MILMVQVSYVIRHILPRSYISWLWYTGTNPACVGFSPSAQAGPLQLLINFQYFVVFVGNKMLIFLKFYYMKTFLKYITISPRVKLYYKIFSNMTYIAVKNKNKTKQNKQKNKNSRYNWLIWIWQCNSRWWSNNCHRRTRAGAIYEAIEIVTNEEQIKLCAPSTIIGRCEL